MSHQLKKKQSDDPTTTMVSLKTTYIDSGNQIFSFISFQIREKKTKELQKWKRERRTERCMK
jgi:hypothetical protein